MIRRFLSLEWKSFSRSASFQTNLALKILMGIGALYFIGCFLIMGLAVYPILKEQGYNPVQTINRALIYYLVLDLFIRYFLQKMPVMNIRPMMILPMKKSTVVHFLLGKTFFSFFNILHAFFFLPFTIMMLYKGEAPLSALSWWLAMWALIYVNNFVNVLINNKDAVFYPVAALVLGSAVAQYYGYFDLTQWTAPFFQALFDQPFLVVIPLAVLALLYWATFRFFYHEMHLDEKLASKSEIAKTEDFSWLNQFGTLGTFLKNDLRLLKRNKRSRTTIIMSVLFIAYGLLFYTNSIEAYKAPAFQMFAAIFCTGGFLFTFGQFVPSWDSAYYPLMMSQNIQYRDYLMSKWWLMVIATFVSTIVASFYLYFGWDVYKMILVGAVFNMGFNAHLVLLGGAFVKTPIDLTTSKQAFGNKQAFNAKTMLISLPKMLLPMALYSIGYYTHSSDLGVLLVLAAGILGFAFRDKVFTRIERIYKTEKYATIAAYKQKA